MGGLFDLAGRVAVVTGGAGIYGASISEALAEAGATVVIASRQLDRCEAAAARLRDRGLHAAGEAYDQADEASILALRDRVFARFESVDILVNNAVHRVMKRYQDPLAKWRDSMLANATGLFCISRAFLDPMMARGRGSLIQVGSIQGIVAPRLDTYAGTDASTPPDYHFHKHGLVGLTRYLAAIAGPRGVRVNALSPGACDPGFVREPILSQYSNHVLLGRLARPSEIQGATVFLASDASSYVTGHNLVVDGGYCA